MEKNFQIHDMYLHKTRLNEGQLYGSRTTTAAQFRGFIRIPYLQITQRYIF